MVNNYHYAILTIKISVFTKKTSLLSIEVGFDSYNVIFVYFSLVLISFGINSLRPTYVCVSFSCTIKLCYFGYVEPFHKLSPNLRPKSVTEDHSEVMILIFWPGWSRQQVSAHFSYVLAYL